MTVKKLRTDFQVWRYNDEEFIKRSFKKSVGLDLNLDNPQRFTEKMQWIKLNGCTPQMSLCADKLAVRKYVKEKNFGDTLNELINTYTSVDEIDLNELPDKFVLKTTHTSGWNLICTDKKKLNRNWFWWRKILNIWIKEDYSKYYRELHYKNIPHKIICEKFMGDATNGLNDYKFFCFKGTIKMIQVDIARYSNHKQNFYDENWNLIEMEAGYGGHFNPNLHKPKKLEEMKNICRILSKEFPFVRVDLFEWNDKIYFGEMTFIDGSGYYKTEPKEFDYEMGKWLELSAV